MRQNGPVSGHEIEIRDDQKIISRTDPHGRIEYVNADFIEISGFSDSELIGQPHNIIRHPDMPEAVFADLWANLKAGRPWIGILQNLNKNGDSYWVEAHVSPVWDKGQLTGYLSMRQRARPEQIAHARDAYARLRESAAAADSLKHGDPSATSGWGRIRRFFEKLPLSAKFTASSLLAALSILGGASYFLAGHVSDTLNTNTTEALQHDIALLKAAVSARVETTTQTAQNKAAIMAERTYRALGGRAAATGARLDALTRGALDTQGIQAIEPYIRDLDITGTLFLKTSAGFERRLTSAVGEHGETPVDTLLAEDHPAYAALQAGDTYVGPARVFGRAYFTCYRPLRDTQGETIGAVAVGLDFDKEFETLKTQIRQLRVGETGYYYIVDATPGANFGNAVLHPYKEGKQLTARLADHERELIATMARMHSGKLTYLWQNAEAGETEMREKIVVFDMLDSPRWIIAGGSTTQEFTAPANRVVWMVIVTGLLITGTIFVIINVLLRRLIVRPLHDVVLPTFSALSSGNFDVTLDIRGQDEIAQLIQGLESLRNRLAFESERERALGQMRETARQEAESLSKARAEFLANMSHEIRTPLNAVIGLAYLLMQSKLGARETEYVQRIESAGKLLLGIINDVLDFSKIDAGRMQLESAPFRLDDVLDNLSSLMRNRIHEKNLILDYVVDPSVPQQLRGDALRLSQILINLVGNAVKFTADGSITVFVSAESTKDQKVDLEFRIQDTGIGMSEEQQEGLFQAFAQADTSVTRRFGGTGLGLAICRRLVTMMEGSIGVDSTPHVGSTFTFRVRLDACDEQPETQAHPGYRVLVVDDNALSRQVLFRLLEKQGCVVEMADSGGQALSILRKSESPFNCVMLDLNMPGIDGLALASMIRSKFGSSTRLIMVTSENTNTAQLRNAFGDFDEVMEKPVTAAHLADVLTRMRDMKPAPSLPAKPVKKAQFAGLRILVAEDIPTNQLIIRDLLESLGATVMLADNGLLALQQFQANASAIDLILMDIQMPEMDGLEATRRIRAASPPGLRTPIIALTAHALEDERKRASEAGMDDFLTKPIEPEQLVNKLSTWRSQPKPPEPAQPAPPAPVSEAPLPDLPGIDTVDGLRRMMGRRALYEKVLHDFHARFTGEADRIRQALHQGDQESAGRRAHSLKGTGGTIGARDLAALAQTLEAAIKQQAPETLDHLMAFEAELQRILQGIQEHLA